MPDLPETARGRLAFTLSEVEREALGRRWSEHPALAYSGIRASVTPDSVRATLSPVAAHHRGGLGTDAVNGGVLAGLFDLVLGLPGQLCLGTRTGTLQLSMTFMRPVRGDAVHAEGWCERISTHHAFTAATILDEQGVVCARAQGVVAAADRRPDPGA